MFICIFTYYVFIMKYVKQLSQTISSTMLHVACPAARVREDVAMSGDTSEKRV